MNTTFYLLRHAESSPSKDLAEVHWPLSAKGEEQAALLIDDLRKLNVDRVFSSPFLRARKTVEPFCTSEGHALQVAPQLRERLAKTAYVEDFDGLMKKAWLDLDFSLPECETGRQCQKRMFEYCLSLDELYSGETLLLSSHGNAIALMLNVIDDSFGFEEWRNMENPDLFGIQAKQGQFHMMPMPSGVES